VNWDGNVKHYARFTDRSYYSSASQTYPAPADVINDIIDVLACEMITDPLTKSVMTFHSTSERLQSVVSDWEPSPVRMGSTWRTAPGQRLLRPQTYTTSSRSTRILLMTDDCPRFGVLR